MHLRRIWLRLVEDAPGVLIAWHLGPCEIRAIFSRCKGKTSPGALHSGHEMPMLLGSTWTQSYPSRPSLFGGSSCLTEVSFPKKCLCKGRVLYPGMSQSAQCITKDLSSEVLRQVLGPKSRPPRVCSMGGGLMQGVCPKRHRNKRNIAEWGGAEQGR